MTADLAKVLVLLLGAVVMFAINRPRMDAVALIMIVCLPLTGVISANEALAGFADPNIVLIAALFVIGEGLVRTGVARAVGDLIIRKTGTSEVRLLVLLMLAVCALGSFMSSTAVAAIFIPIALRIAASTGGAPGRLMMPISFAALISGMMTLVATAPNLVVNSELVRQGEKGFNFFAFTPFGVPVLVLGILYMLVARRWLPSTRDEAPAGRVSLADWVEEFELVDREHRLRVDERSPLVGKTLAELNLRGSSGANVIAVERLSRFTRELMQPTNTLRIQAGDVLLVDLYRESTEIDELRERFVLESLPLVGGYFNDRSQELGMAQLIVPPDSPLVGRSLVEAAFRSRTGLTVIGMRRGSEALGKELLTEPMRVGDTLLVVGAWRKIERVRPEDSGALLLRLPVEIDEVLPAPGKAIAALGCLVLVIVLMATGAVPNVIAALLGCLLMGLLGCIDLNSAYRAVSWKTIVLIVGMLPFSLALQRTGGVDMAADALLAVTDGVGPRVVLAAIFAMTAVLGMFMSNTATAVLMAPIAIAVAKDIGASPYPFAMTVALAASTAFVTPVSSPVNSIVVTPGKYSFGDFVRIGGPFALVVMIVTVLLVPLVLPFGIGAM